ncbi:uncharacterized protein LOC119980314 [Tripterygium wilfordii]|uniref:uncharacterized protein LOC119980314 n=1 Tax=Tripterygium wilfordii TaxID=458696 RepID=UPI0018F84574|nr:uncharacterized protein LOC119980314 [Tripterygium wilfordii]
MTFMGYIVFTQITRGLGFRNFSAFNDALLAKQSLLSVRSLVQEGLRWRIGDGFSVGISADRWLSKPLLFDRDVEIAGFNVCSRVQSLFDPQTNWWNIQLVQSIFIHECKF